MLLTTLTPLISKVGYIIASKLHGFEPTKWQMKRSDSCHSWWNPINFKRVEKLGQATELSLNCTVLNSQSDDMLW